MVERTKRRTEELNTAMDDTESDVMEPDMPASGSEHEDNIDMINDQTEIDLARQQRSPGARSRKDSTSSGGQKKKATSVIKAQKQNPSERKSSVRECVECDSASVDSLKLNEECSPEQIMDLIDDALKNDRRSLERLVQEPINHFPVLEEATASQLLELLLRNPQLPVYGQVRWLKQLLAMSTGSVVLKKAEYRKLIEPMLDRTSSISEHCLRLRGKLDLLMGPSEAVS
ncbi:uncharacterized protein LOC111261580 [Varroa jacobsoni]|uniref:Uncharacterized protein n=1 Tax=Varroa destructor TaxID=109461 RepID=A0A7M7K3G6_VARDE|nr:uncharacterized protein LOC111250191 [Varroa destructor]XP_022690921.1 uncharacterized protein LOC111261580 [Varroa jacobsoni]